MVECDVTCLSLFILCTILKYIRVCIQIVEGFQKNYPDMKLLIEMKNSSKAICNKASQIRNSKIKCVYFPEGCRSNIGCVHNRLINSTGEKSVIMLYYTITYYVKLPVCIRYM